MQHEAAASAESFKNREPLAIARPCTAVRRRNDFRKLDGSTWLGAPKHLRESGDPVWQSKRVEQQALVN